MTHKRQAWVVTAVVFVAGVAVAANRFKVPPVLPILMVELEVDMVSGGWLMSVSSLAGIILAIPTAFLLTRIGLKRIGLVAMGCGLLGTIVGAGAHSAGTMLMGRIIEGISVSLITVLAPTAISLWFEPRQRGLPMGIWATWVPVGNVIAFNSAQPLLAAFDWRAVWWFGAGLAFVALVLVALVLASPSDSESKGKRRPPPPPGDFGRMLFNPTSWLLSASFAAFGFSILGFNTWAPTFLTESLGVEPAAANSQASLMFLAAIPANLLAGWLINRLKNRYLLLPAAFAVTGLLFFWSFGLSSVAQVVPYMLALGFASNFIPTATFTLAPETMPSVEYAGLGQAIVMAGTGLGALAGPPALGAMLKRGDWAAGSISLLLVMVMGTLFAWAVSIKLQKAETGH